MMLLCSWTLACLPDNPTVTTEGSESSDTGMTGEPTGGPLTGLFACTSPPCQLVLVSQTLDDRVDVFEVGVTPPVLRGRIDLDLKPDPTGQQISGNLLDEPYDLVATPGDLLITVGHYPNTDQGSLVRFPLTTFGGVGLGETYAVDNYFSSGNFSAGVEALAHGRREGIFLQQHPSGRLLIGVFANNLQTTTWTNPSEVLVVDPSDLSKPPASINLAPVDPPCIGAWQLEALDDDVSKVAVACDGSASVAVMSFPPSFGSGSLAEDAASVTTCGLNLGGGTDPWATQFVARDGKDGFLAIQAQLGRSPRLWHVRDDCTPRGIPVGEQPLPEVRIVRQPVLLEADAPGPVWLAAAGAMVPGVVVIAGAVSPQVCGRVTGLDDLATGNSPWSLALDRTRTHLAIGAGPPSNPELSEGRGQVLWATLDLEKLDECKVGATEVVDLNAGLFQAANPKTWVRAPNRIVIAELSGAGG